MMTVTISTCGTSIFTNPASDEDKKFFRVNANKNESEYTPEGLKKNDLEGCSARSL